jgi:hypothetical protein
MRSRNDVLDTYLNFAGEDPRPSAAHSQVQLQVCILEVLLDIRDLLAAESGKAEKPVSS